MRNPLHVTIRDIPHSEALESLIREKAAKLDARHDQIIGCHVVLETANKSQHRGKLYNVRIDLTVPGGELAVNRNAAEDAYVAVREAFDSALRRLDEHVARQRGDVKTHA